jgi:hypothetical protein
MTPTTELLAELIGRKLDCLHTLSDLGGKQLEVVRADRIVALLDVLAVKQRVILELQRIERELAPFRDQDPDRRQWSTPERRRQCALQVDECERLLREIVAQERQSEQELTRRRDDLSVQLQGMHRASQAHGAYTAQSHARGSRIDLASEE